MAFAQRFTEAWKARFETRADFVRAVGCQYHQADKWEKGRVPDAANLKKIAIVTGRSTDWLLELDDKGLQGGPVIHEDVKAAAARYGLDDDETRALACWRNALGSPGPGAVMNDAERLRQARPEPKVPASTEPAPKLKRSASATQIRAVR